MRCAEVSLRPTGEGFHPAEHAIVESDEVERVCVHYFNQLDDGSVVFLSQLRGDPEAARTILEVSDDVVAYSVAGDEGDVLASIHFHPNEAVDTLFRLPQEHGLVVDTPIECLSDGGIRVTAIGEAATLTASIGLIPDDVDVELEVMRSYEPDQRGLSSLLTERQREILEAAIDQGYYAVPRQATTEDVARELDLASVTVGEHLRKIESRVLPQIIPE
ncbi:MAG: helix-turn-helix domain-containing protein [Halobacteriales archaeon]